MSREKDSVALAGADDRARRPSHSTAVGQARVAKRAWIVSELYYPEETSTGHFMTRLAEGIAGCRRPVGVLCSQPTYSARGAQAPWREERHSVRIERCRATAFDKNRLPSRMLNAVTITLSIFTKAVRVVRRDDVVVVATNPPLLPFAMAAVCRLRGARSVLRIDDLYPEVLEATGFLAADSIAATTLRSATRGLFRRFDRIVVIGRDMKELVDRRVGHDQSTRVIPHWADLELVVPGAKNENRLLSELELQGKFVVQCAGNMGRAQAIEGMLAAAELLRDDPTIHFLFIGSGAKQAWMEEQVSEKRLTNVALVGQRPRSDQTNFLNACDVALISLVPGMTGVSVPSRLYNIMAAGKPVIAFAEADSEVCRVVLEEGIGWVVDPKAPKELAKVIEEARRKPERLAGMGKRAREVAESKYSEAVAVRHFESVLEELD